MHYSTQYISQYYEIKYHDIVDLHIEENTLVISCCYNIQNLRSYTVLSHITIA